MTTTTMTAEVNGTMFEIGSYIDGSRMNVDDLNIATIRFADTTLGGARFAAEAADYIAVVKDETPGDYADAAMALEEIADEAVGALTDATSDGFYWDVHESTLMLTADEEE